MSDTVKLGDVEWCRVGANLFRNHVHVASFHDWRVVVELLKALRSQNPVSLGRERE